MDKYGVDEQVSEEKRAGLKTNRCPECNELLLDTDETGVLVCPKCGTRPFEEE